MIVFNCFFGITTIFFAVEILNSHSFPEYLKNSDNALFMRLNLSLQVTLPQNVFFLSLIQVSFFSSSSSSLVFE